MIKKDVFLLNLIIIISVYKAISHEDVVHHRNQYVRQEILISRRVGQDLTNRNSVGRKISLKDLFPDWP